MKTATEPEFACGTQVMVPFHGLCEVQGLHEEQILGESCLFYHLQPQNDKTLLKIPVDQAAARGVRAVAEREQLTEILKRTQENWSPEGQTPSTRLKHWNEMLRSGEAGCRLQILQQIQQTEQSFRLTKPEQELRDRLRLAFRSEVQVVLDISGAHAGRLVNQATAGLQ